MLKGEDLLPKQDEYGTVMNSPKTYRYIAEMLKIWGSVMIASISS